MSGAAVVMAIVLFIFFLAGIAAGIFVVIAAAARRDRSPRRPRGRRPDPDETGPDDEPDQPPWWHARGDE